MKALKAVIAFLTLVGIVLLIIMIPGLEKPGYGQEKSAFLTTPVLSTHADMVRTWATIPARNINVVSFSTAPTTEDKQPISEVSGVVKKITPSARDKPTQATSI